VEYDGNPLTGKLDGPHCDYAPHFYIVKEFREDSVEVMPYGPQHCCMDHGDGLCVGWICLTLESINMKESQWPSMEISEADEESPHQHP
jgi:hypothetical protein